MWMPSIGVALSVFDPTYLAWFGSGRGSSCRILPDSAGTPHLTRNSFSKWGMRLRLAR